jgi:hypothetical protein
MRIPAQATVDRLRSGLYEVRVSGGNRDRTYNIAERTEDRAAMEGLRQFHDEMVNLESGV